MPSLNRSLPIAIIASFAFAPAAQAQDSVQKVKDLYASAAYEDTLSAASRLAVSEPKLEVEQYRVFSLVALGRLAEAEHAVEAFLRSNLRYHPDPAEASPRIQELFTTVRRRIAPDAIKGLYRDGKAALDKKDREAAIALFDAMLLTADDADIKDQPWVGELRLLGAGFLELSRALPGAPSGGAAGNHAGAPATAKPVTPAASLPVLLTGPVAIRQDLPPWFSGTAPQREYSGTIRVMISANGTVESAEILQPIHPAYDPLLLAAARNWEYQPARRNGVAMPSEKMVTVRLKPSQ